MRQFHAPGRINLIGDHIDYLGGVVLPMAIDRGTDLVLAKRTDRELHAYSENFPAQGTIVTALDASAPNPDWGWANYLVGVAHAFAHAGNRLPHGYDIRVQGSIPNGAGLSSSASLELAFAVAINADLDLGLTAAQLALLCQSAENDFVGVACGIMDQLSIAAGRRGNALAIDCHDLAVELVAFPDDVAVVVANTNKRRELADSAYNDRRAACEKAQAELGRRLVDIPLTELTAVVAGFDPQTGRRVRHVVTEQHRVRECIQALRVRDLALVGQLMRESHESLRDDFQVTGPELDALVEAAWHAPGMIGARMTGAGFGGCTVNLVWPGAVAEFTESVRARYTDKTGLAADFYLVASADGAREVGLDR